MIPQFSLICKKFKQKKGDDTGWEVLRGMVFTCNMENPPIRNPSLARLHLANIHVPVHASDNLSILYLSLYLVLYEMCVTGTEKKFRSSWSRGMLDHVNWQIQKWPCGVPRHSWAISSPWCLPAVGRAGQTSQLMLLKGMAKQQTSLPQAKPMISVNLSSPFLTNLSFLIISNYHVRQLKHKAH